jgi:hypothetical protein
MHNLTTLSKLGLIVLAAATCACGGRPLAEPVRDLDDTADAGAIPELGPGPDAAPGGASWVAVAGGSGDVTTSGIAADKAGNSWVAGNLRGTATIGVTTLTSKGDGALFVASVDAQGKFRWATAASPAQPTYRATATSVAVDSAGNSYITGNIIGGIEFGKYGLKSSTPDSSSIFVAKLDPQGSFRWAKAVYGSGKHDGGTAVAVDGAGNAYVTGSFGGTAKFGGFSLSGGGLYNVFVAKLSPQGTFLWARAAAGSGGEHAWGLAVDAAGNSTVTGYHRGTIDFGAGAIVSSTSKGETLFITRLDSNGGAQWVTGASGTGHSRGLEAALDSAGNSYVAGDVGGTAMIGTTSLTSKGAQDLFVTKLSPKGKVLWVRAIKGSEYKTVSGIAVTATGRCSVVGHFDATATFGVVSKTASGKADIFLVSLDSAGAFSEIRAAGGPAMEFPSGVALDSAGARYVTGGFKQTTTLGGITVTTKDVKSFFVWKNP